MRILFVSNYFPPHSRGGYEQWCQEVATELVQRGHQVDVLSSQTPEGKTVYRDNGVGVHRLLHLDVEAGLAETVGRLLFSRKKLEQENIENSKQVINDLQPDAAMIWGMWNISRSVPALVEEMLPNRVSYFLCDYWLSLPSAYVQRWQVTSRNKLMQFPKQLLGNYFLAQLSKETPIDLNLEHPICVSQAVRELLVEAGVSVEHACVIYGGTQVEDFVAAAHNRRNGQKNQLKLLYVGRLTQDKGVHTAVQAIALIKRPPNTQVKLDIYGKGHPDYITDLKMLIEQRNLQNTVSLKGSVPRAQIPAIMAQYDGLIFPSEWEEPFARTVLEAMAAGLVVIGTTTGGTGEILIEGETGLTFPAGSDTVAATQINRLLGDYPLRQKLAQAGQRCVIEKFTFARMVDQFETALEQIHLK